MQDLLYLAHRIPYPPNKGDKVRSFNEVKYLAQRYRVHLGAFIDDSADWEHVEALKQYCGETHFVSLNSKLARLKSARGLLTGEALTLPYYRDAGLDAWVKHMLASHSIRHVVIYSSPMAQYVRGISGVRRIADFVDVDSDKWRQYAPTKSWPLSWVYAREAEKLLAFERSVAAEFDATLLVAPHEAQLLRDIAPESAARIHHANNGVDADFFSPAHRFETPYTGNELPIVFTGAMDYWPNIDAVEWFADEIFPSVRAQHPQAHFYVVGARPSPRLQRLNAMDCVTVTGGVPDVRPYIAHAQLAVAPLRIARGIQNKVLEAMAMAKAIVVSPHAAAGIAADVEKEFVVAADAQAFAVQVNRLLTADLRHAIGEVGRARVLADYSWEANLSKFDTLLSDATPPQGGTVSRSREAIG